ncbi:MAG: YifB family Mg chelatase-like AAA ATPase [Gammaproteobacteria bacterium]
MSYATLFSRAETGIHAPQVTVETHISNGLPRLSIVGLPEKAVKESKDRVRSAILNSNFQFPTRCITVNLAPADLPKQSCRFDLAIALSILLASKQLTVDDLSNYEFACELSLSGELRPIKGILPFALASNTAQRTLVIAPRNAQEASLIKGIKLITADHLLEVCEILKNKGSHSYYQPKPIIAAPNKATDLAEVQGQAHAKRALIIAAAGNHNLLMIGPPGSGKSMLANCLNSLLPPLDEKQALESAAIYSITAHGFNPLRWRQRPFRAPHHTASTIAIVGGGRPPQPGEITLAHHGTLFLDELPEFKRAAIESLREPLETGSIMISRVGQQNQFPACIQLVAAMNPCPCGYLGDTTHTCRCTTPQIQRYLSKLSGPLLDRIDLQIQVPLLPLSTLMTPAHQPSLTSKQAQQFIQEARQRQYQRQQKLNDTLNNQELEHVCQLTTQEFTVLDQLTQKHKLSARSYYRLLKVARTIADLAQQSVVNTQHIAEAAQYRQFHRYTQYL